jgi:hypothetical protein
MDLVTSSNDNSAALSMLRAESGGINFSADALPKLGVFLLPHITKNASLDPPSHLTNGCAR